MMFHLPAGPTLRKYPILGVLIGVTLVMVFWLGLQSGMDETRALFEQKSPALVSVREATQPHGIRWITLSDGTWHCAGAVRIKRTEVIPRLISGPVASTELLITGENDVDVVVAAFDNDFDCSGKPVRLSGVIGSMEIFGGQETRARWQTAGRRVTVLSVGASPSTVAWMFSAGVCGLLVGVVAAGYFLRLLVLKYTDPER
jgi:hypothetical protein